MGRDHPYLEGLTNVTRQVRETAKIRTKKIFSASNLLTKYLKTCFCLFVPITLRMERNPSPFTPYVSDFLFLLNAI